MPNKQEPNVRISRLHNRRMREFGKSMNRWWSMAELDKELAKIEKRYDFLFQLLQDHIEHDELLKVMNEDPEEWGCLYCGHNIPDAKKTGRLVCLECASK